MSDKTFVDTNVLIYAHDVDAPAKRQIANRLLDELWEERTGVLSVQVLQEFYVNVTRKIARPLAKASARQVVNAYAVWAVGVTPAEVASAFRIEDEARIGFWDALIVACALKSGANRIVSEDLNAGQRIGGIRIENPFPSRAS
jgi:predicted nucleic acid-binding protein